MLIILAFIALLILPVVAVVLFNRYYSPSHIETPELDTMDAIDKAMLVKYEQADIHKNRPYALVIGLFITLLFTYLALEYKAYENEVVEKKVDNQLLEDKIEVIQITQIEPPPPPPEKKSIVLEVVEDEELIEKDEEEKEEIVIKEDFYDPNDEDEEEEEVVVAKAPEVFASTEIRAEPVGGMMVFNNNLMQALVPRLQALGDYLDDVSAGVVMLKFIVMENGSVANLAVMQGLDPVLDKIVVAEFQKLAKYTPGKNQGQPVRSHMQYPVIVMFE